MSWGSQAPQCVLMFSDHAQVQTVSVDVEDISQLVLFNIAFQHRYSGVVLQQVPPMSTWFRSAARAVISSASASRDAIGFSTNTCLS